MLILSNANPTATAKKCYFENKCSIGLNDGRRRTMRKKAVPRAVAGYAQHQKIKICVWDTTQKEHTSL